MSTLKPSPRPPCLPTRPDPSSLPPRPPFEASEPSQSHPATSEADLPYLEALPKPTPVVNEGSPRPGKKPDPLKTWYSVSPLETLIPAQRWGFSLIRAGIYPPRPSRGNFPHSATLPVRYPRSQPRPCHLPRRRAPAAYPYSNGVPPPSTSTPRSHRLPLLRRRAPAAYPYSDGVAPAVYLDAAPPPPTPTPKAHPAVYLDAAPPPPTPTPTSRPRRLPLLRRRAPAIYLDAAPPPPTPTPTARPRHLPRRRSEYTCYRIKIDAAPPPPTLLRRRAPAAYPYSDGVPPPSTSTPRPPPPTSMFAMLMSQAARMKKSPKVTAIRVMTQLDNTTDIGDTEATFPDVEDTFAYQVQDNVGARVDSFEEVENIGSNEHRAERDSQWEEIRTLKDVVLFLNSQLDRHLRDEISTLTGQIQCLAEELT
ncbi:hypothetical protein GUJ93_ZPchr0013g34467 [Zizania palustris]|uniref:Uncharacterized protein n=1 Tax=Zizania palustris TaxID=103762 RepID=A0A8J5WTG0_ZIZPA|nr:hypothetical protein GUJ93_ZPchr0013g34467 [Zizania palustris]